MGGQDRQGGIAIPGGEALFSSLFGQTSVGVAVGSPDGRFLRVNDALCRMLGYEVDELLNRSFQEVTHPDDQQASQEFQQELLTTSQSRVYEKRYLRKDGSTVWVRITGTLLRDDAARRGEARLRAGGVHRPGPLGSSRRGAAAREGVAAASRQARAA
jgi:PAS domain S-box-containing protein